jgi:hypothetical protein
MRKVLIIDTLDLYFARKVFIPDTLRRASIQRKSPGIYRGFSMLYIHYNLWTELIGQAIWPVWQGFSMIRA